MALQPPGLRPRDPDSAGYPSPSDPTFSRGDAGASPPTPPDPPLRDPSSGPPLRLPSSSLAPRTPTVLAVVVTHDGRRWLEDCLSSLDRQSHPLLDVVVVDDCSPEAPGEPSLRSVAGDALRRRRHTVLRTPSSFGFGGAVNWALDRLRPDAELLLFVHDDAALDPDSVERMVGRMSLDPGTAIVGPKVVAWDEPTLLEEVGWATDRFGHGYHGLEEGERDSGQRDLAREVFHVTSTCMLVRSSVFHGLSGWDTRMRAFCEDLDLCWRARLAGHRVEVDPAARVRHAAALTHRARRMTWGPIRYLVRRNRFRAVAKNSSALRLLWIVPQLVLFALAEMAGFLIVRRPRAALQVARALGWSLAALPAILPARRRVQRSRKIPDGSLRRFTVPATIRMRSYISRRSDRLEAVLGRHTKALLVGARAPVRAGSKVIPVAAVTGILMLLGIRGPLTAPPLAVGELLPFPEGATAMFRAFARRASDPGAGGPSPPALLVLGVFPVLALGASALAQKLLLICLGLAAGAGAYRLVAPWTGEGRAGRLGAWVAAVAYVAGPVGYSGMRSGRLGALVFGAVAPWVAGAIVRLCGPVLPDGSGSGARRPAGREALRIALGGGVSAAFVPGSLFLYAGIAVLATVGGALFGGERRAGRLIQPAAAFGGIAAGWVLLLPWSASWWDPGGPLGRLAAGRSGAEGFLVGDGAAAVLLAEFPPGPPLMGATLVLAGVVAVALSRGDGRRFALMLGAWLGLGGLVAALWASGRAPLVVASPIEAGVPLSLAWAGLAGLAVGGALERLRGSGTPAFAAAALLSLLAALGAGSVLPAVAGGGYAPRVTEGGATQAVDDISAFLGAPSEAPGPRHVLWVGAGPGRGGAGSLLVPRSTLRVTEVEGPRLSDIFPVDGVAPALARWVASVEAGGTDRAGRLLAQRDIGFVVVSGRGGRRRSAWLGQRDLAIVSEGAGYLLFANAAGSPPHG